MFLSDCDRVDLSTTLGTLAAVDCAECVTRNYEYTVAPGDPDADGTMLIRSPIEVSCMPGVDAMLPTLYCPDEGHGSLCVVSDCANESVCF